MTEDHSTQRNTFEQLEQQTKLFERETDLRLVIQNLPIMIAATDSDNNFVVWNREVERFTGYSESEVIGNPRILDKLWPDPEYHQQLKNRLIGMVSKHDLIQDIEWDITCKDGSNKTTRHIITYELFPIPECVQWTIGFDVTEDKRIEAERQKVQDELEQRVRERTKELTILNDTLENEIIEHLQAEKTLHHQNAILSALNDIAASSSQSINLDQTLHLALERAANILKVKGIWIQLFTSDKEEPQLRMVEQKGLSVDQIAIINNYPPGYGLASMVARTGRSLVINLLQPDSFRLGDEGSDYILACHPLKSRDTVLGVFCISGQLRQVNSQDLEVLAGFGNQLGLIIENARLTKQITNQEIKREVDRMQSELIANVSHELRTPLGLIRIFTTTLLREDAEFDQKTQREFLKDIDEETRTLEAIIDNLLAKNFLESSEFHLDKHPADLTNLLIGATTQFEEWVNLHQMTVNLPDQPLMANVDKKSIELVFRNLLDNAIKYSPEGGNLSIYGYRNEEQIILQFTDSGIGIPYEDQNMVFQRFYRVNNNITRQVRGSGIGLSISREIIQAHGGYITVESTPGHGSTFSVILPGHSF